jgi:hypothetical protein
MAMVIGVLEVLFVSLGACQHCTLENIMIASLKSSIYSSFINIYPSESNLHHQWKFTSLVKLLKKQKVSQYICREKIIFTVSVQYKPGFAWRYIEFRIVFYERLIIIKIGKIKGGKHFLYCTTFTPNTFDIFYTSGNKKTSCITLHVTE